MVTLGPIEKNPRNSIRGSAFDGAREIVEAIDILYRVVVSILSNHLDMRKMTARWVLRLLIINHKRNFLTISTEGLALFNRNLVKFLRCFITVVKRWVHHTIPYIKLQSKQCISPSDSAPKKTNEQSMVSIVSTCWIRSTTI